MRLKITQRGGFVGDEVTLAEIDTERLDAGARREVENMVASTRARGASRGAAVGADLLEYNLTVDGQTMSWKDDGGEAAAPIRDLLARVQQLQ